MTRPPRRSLRTPNIGAASVPRNCSEPKTVSNSTEPVWTITYQPRMTISISNAHEVSRSADHWKRKLRTRKAARLNGPRGSDARARHWTRRSVRYNICRHANRLSGWRRLRSAPPRARAPAQARPGGLLRRPPARPEPADRAPAAGRGSDPRLLGDGRRG